MPKVEIPVMNYEVVGNHLGITFKEGPKNVVAEGNGIRVSGVIQDKSNKLAKLDWITASKESGKTYKEVLGQILELSGIPLDQLPSVPKQTSQPQPTQPVKKEEDKQEKLKRRVKEIEADIAKALGNLKFEDQQGTAVFHAEGSEWYGRAWKIIDGSPTFGEVQKRAIIGFLPVSKYVSMKFGYDDSPNVRRFTISARVAMQPLKEALEME